MGSCTGFSTNINAVKRWKINTAYRATIRTVFHKHFNYDVQKYIHPDLNPSRIKKDQDVVGNILGIYRPFESSSIDVYEMHEVYQIEFLYCKLKKFFVTNIFVCIWIRIRVRKIIKAKLFDLFD